MLVALRSVVQKDAFLLKQFYGFGIIKFKLPDLGEKIKEGTIKKLYVSEGDTVEEFQKLADVASDKQFTQITASDSGVITKIHYSEQDICQVGELFLEIKTDGDTQNAQNQQTVNPPSEEVPNKTQSQSSANESKSNPDGGVLATPYVRGLIKKNNLNINEIKGTGDGGRILQADVQAALQGSKPRRTPSIQFGKRGPQTEAPSSTSKSISRGSTSNVESSETIKMSLFEKGMQKSMTVANTIPHLYLHEEIDLTECEKLRNTLKASNRKVTVMGLLIKTFSLALKKYPRINSTYEPEKSQFEFTQHNNHNISIAIDSPNGLVVPNIKNVQSMNLVNIQSEIQRLRNLSVEAKLTATELQSGTVCLSNIGTIGGIMANPLILAPQVCIVAIGKLQHVQRYVGGQFVHRKVINVSFGCDHRIVDGATVARFSNQWKSLLENPYIAMAEMV